MFTKLEKSFGWSTTEMTTKVLVYGYYNKSNLGDDLFTDAFKGLFPDYQFTFTDVIKEDQLNKVDAVFFGGGSFLAESLKADNKAFQKLKTMKLFYIGVGSETAFDPRHKELISIAELVAVRTTQNLEQLQAVTDKYLVIPDLVYSLVGYQNGEKKPKSILVIPNILVVPKWNDPHWKHAAWEYFKIEFAQVIDQLIADGFKVDFLPFCQNNYLNDSYAAGELIAKTNTITPKLLHRQPDDFTHAMDIMTRYEAVVTQRFHGSILADIAGVPSLSIYHHDKLKGVRGASTPYYGTSKAVLLDNIKTLVDSGTVLPIDRDIFIELKRRVEHALCRSKA